MADDADFSILNENAFIEEALRQHRLRTQLATEPYSNCEDCGSSIPAARAAIPGVTRCIECQRVEEKFNKRY